MPEWQGADALNNGDLAKQFWDMVAEKGDPTRLEVGDVATLEQTRNGKVVGHRLVRVTKKMTSDKGEPQVQLEDLPPDTAYIHSGITLVVS